jgi:UDP:flavonoid glycosyltransferase YjiC (YdhE family)
MTTFLAYTSPAAGHVFPLMPGLLELSRRGHEIHLRTDPALVAGLRRTGLSVEAVDPRISEIRPGASREGNELRAAYRALLDRGRFDLPDLELAIAETEANVVLVDVLAYGAGIAAERSGLPWAMTLPSLLPLPGAGIPPYGLGLAPRRGRLGTVRDRFGWWLVERAYSRALMPGLNQLRAHAGLRPLGSPLDPLGIPDRVLALSGAPLEYPRTDLPPNIDLVGACSWDPPVPASERPIYLEEEGDPWVLVTCSTDYQGDELLAATAIEALRDEPVRVLVTLADASGTANLPRADNVRVERFVPHQPVLEKAAAVICHGGMGIVQKSLSSAVPLVSVPFGRDQPEIGRRLRESGTGRVVSRRSLTPRRLRAAVREAMEDRAAAEAAANAINAGDPAGVFADRCELLSRSRPPIPILAP